MVALRLLRTWSALLLPIIVCLCSLPAHLLLKRASLLPSVVPIGGTFDWRLGCRAAKLSQFPAGKG